MNKEIEHLKKAFVKYYSTEYSEENDTLENFKIRKQAVELLTTALKMHDERFADQVLNCISENTGSMEDLAIFEELIAPLVDSQMLTQDQIDIVLNARAIARWGEGP